MLKRYKISFDIWALGLFLSVMLPNFFWFAVPAPEDILRADSVTAGPDAIASVCQIWMAAALCAVRNREAGKRRAAPLPILAGGCVLLYYISWAAYYRGAVNALVIMGLTFPPCLAFLFYAIDRKNWPAVLPAGIFTACHGAYAACNFLL